jgi:hypothetical protein
MYKRQQNGPTGAKNASADALGAEPRDWSLAPESFFLAALLGLGVFLRAWQYFFNRSLWLDEAYLAASTLGASVTELLTQPLGNNQAAPLGFLLLVKATVGLLGHSDLALRAIPFLSGIVSLFAAWRLGRLVLVHPGALLLFVGLVACAPVLVYYASEFKQYSGDVMVGLLVFWAGAAFRPERWRSGAAILALAGGLGLWFSHSSVFVLAGVGASLWLHCAINRRWAALAGISLTGFVWLLSFAINYWLSLKTLSSNPNLINYWTVGYAPLPPRTVADLYWYWESGLGLVYLAFRHIGITGPWVSPAWLDAYNVVLLFLTLAGLVALFVTSRRIFGFVVLTVAAVILASSLHLYPFRSRLILVLVPLVLLAAASFFDWLFARRTAAWRGLAGAGAIGLLVATAWPALGKIAEPYNHFDIKGAMAHVQANRQATDTLVLSTWTHKAFSVYAHRYGLDNAPLITYIQTRNAAADANGWLHSACNKGTPGRVWFMFSHRFEEQGPFLERVQSAATLLDAWEGNGAGTYLFDFGHGAACGD